MSLLASIPVPFGASVCESQFDCEQGVMQDRAEKAKKGHDNTSDHSLVNKGFATALLTTHYS